MNGSPDARGSARIGRVSYRVPICLCLTLCLAAAPALARTPVPVPKPRPGSAAVVVPSPPTASDTGRHRHSLTDIPDMSKAVPIDQIGKLPTSAERYRSLQQQVDTSKPKVEGAKSKSEALKAETKRLRRQLIDTAARVQDLEAQKAKLDTQIAGLSAKEKVLAQSFQRDRVAVTHLLGLLQRLQHDMPPVLALTSDDALSAARSAMLLGASLPRVYGAAAELARRLDTLRQTRADLVVRRAESARNAVQLAAARKHLDQLLATKTVEADTATARYEKLQAKFAVIAKQATDLGQLLRKVAGLRAEAPAAPAIVTVGAGPVDSHGRLKAGSLLRPVVGRLVEGGIDGVGGSAAPGVTFLTQAGAQVVAPADSKVLFAGPYHKTGQVLILEMAGGYDLVLAGLDRVDVKVGDQVLAGEPLGTMPRSGKGAQLYFEVRHGDKGMSPVPWLDLGLRKAERS